MSVAEMWIPVQWWAWQGGAMPLIASGALGPPMTDFSLTRWVRMVRYHLHISRVNDPSNPDHNAFDATGTRLLNEIVDRGRGLGEPAPNRSRLSSQLYLRIPRSSSKTRTTNSFRCRESSVWSRRGRTPVNLVKVSLAL